MSNACERKRIWTTIFIGMIILLAIVVLIAYFAKDRPAGEFKLAKSILHVGSNIIFGSVALSYYLSYRRLLKKCSETAK